MGGLSIQRTEQSSQLAMANTVVRLLPSPGPGLLLQALGSGGSDLGGPFLFPCVQAEHKAGRSSVLALGLAGWEPEYQGVGPRVGSASVSGWDFEQITFPVPRVGVKLDGLFPGSAPHLRTLHF